MRHLLCGIVRRLRWRKVSHGQWIIGRCGMLRTVNAAVTRWRLSATESMMKTTTVNLKIICVHPPATSDSVSFGLQDKEGNIYNGQPQDDNRLQFSCEVSVKQMESGQPNFTGVFTHGTVQERFLYLTL